MLHVALKQGKAKSCAQDGCGDGPHDIVLCQILAIGMQGQMNDTGAGLRRKRDPSFFSIATMSETEVETSVKNWTGPKEAEYAALLSDLAQLKLSNVNCCGF